MVCCWGHTLRENWLFSWQLPTANASSVGMEFYASSALHAGVLLAWACAGLVHVVTNTAHSYVWLACCVQKRLLRWSSPPSLLPTISLAPLLGWWLSLGCDECGIDISGRVQHCVLSYSLTIFQLWVSVLIAMDSKKKLLCKDWMYWYNIKTLGVGLSLFPYRRIVAVSSTLGFNTCLAIHFWSR